MAPKLSRRGLIRGSVGALPLAAGAASAPRPVASAVALDGDDVEIVELGARAAVERIRRGEMKAEAYITALLRQHERHQNLNAIVSIDPDRILGEAAAVDKARAAGAKLGPLAGLPMVVKDHTDVAGYPTTAAMPRAALGFRVAPKSAPVVQKLQDNGVIIFGKANFAGGATGTNRYFGASRNPYDLRRIAGGSSGGSAAAVAGRIVPAALGEDTGGSIRLPAALSGLAGLRPSTYSLRNFIEGKNSPKTWHKRYSSDGVVPPTSVLTLTLGPIARTLSDVALLDQVITGEPTPALKPADIRLGMPRADYWDRHPHQPNVKATFETAIAKLKGAGVTLVEVDLNALMDLDEGANVWDGLLGDVLARPEGAQEFDEWLAVNAPGITRAKFQEYAVPIAVRREPRNLTPDQKLEIARKAAKIYDAAFTSVRIQSLVFPTSLVTAPLVNENGDTAGQMISVDGKLIEEVHALACNTFWGPRIGAPGVSIPAGLAGGLPVGLCLQGRPGDDGLVLAQGIALETILGHLPPPSFRASMI